MEFPEEELLAPGHRGCAGCGAAIAVRLALKALGRNTVVACATGCLDVMTSPYPETAWEVPWIHVAFENAGAVASGVERALKAQGKEDVCRVLQRSLSLSLCLGNISGLCSESAHCTEVSHQGCR